MPLSIYMLDDLYMEREKLYMRNSGAYRVLFTIGSIQEGDLGDKMYFFSN